MKRRTEKMMTEFFEKNDFTEDIKSAVMDTCHTIIDTYDKGGKLLLCGNGGSCSDCEHIAGELMKGFLLKRPLEESFQSKLKNSSENGHFIAQNLQKAVPAIPLTMGGALATAFSNDVSPHLVYAQQVQALAKKEDILIGISTSGNAQNVQYAMLTAKTMDIKTISISGKDGGKIAKIADINIIVNQQETYKIQEQHILLYHFICAFVESELFDC